MQVINKRQKKKKLCIRKRYMITSLKRNEGRRKKREQSINMKLFGYAWCEGRAFPFLIKKKLFYFLLS